MFPLSQIQVSEEDQLVSNGKSTSDSDLTFDDLNSHLQLELEVIGKNVPEVKVTIVHPEPDVEAKEERELGEYPDMEEMKKYDKVHDADEWNRGLHLRLDFDSKVSSFKARLLNRNRSKVCDNNARIYIE